MDALGDGLGFLVGSGFVAEDVFEAGEARFEEGEGEEDGFVVFFHCECDPSPQCMYVYVYVCMYVYM